MEERRADDRTLEYIREDIQWIRKELSELRKENATYMLKADCRALMNKNEDISKTLVTKSEFAPVKYIVMSSVMVVLTQVVRLLVEGGFIK